MLAAFIRRALGPLFLTLLLPAAPAAAQEIASAQAVRQADLGRIVGAESAAVWVVVISDFQCPFCKRWHEQTGPRLIQEYVRTGRIRMAYLNLPIRSHRNAGPAHEAAMCAAAQDRFWPFADAIFDTQDAWKSRRDPVAFFDSLSARLVAQPRAFRDCIASGTMRPLIANDIQRVERLGVGSTPTFLIGSEVVVGAQPYEVFRAAVERALAATPSP